jgi:hypothetical protein
LPRTQACTKPPDGSNAWTIRKLSRALGIGSTTVHRILKEGHLKPHILVWQKVQKADTGPTTPSNRDLYPPQHHLPVGGPGHA